MSETPLPWEDKAVAAWAETLDWQEYAAAMLAVASHRQDRERSRAAAEADRELTRAVQLVADMGFVTFCKLYARARYEAWRYGIPLEDL